MQENNHSFNVDHSVPPPLPASSLPPPLPGLWNRASAIFRLEAIRNLKSSGKSFDEYDLELEIAKVKASYLREEERKRATESARESAEELRRASTSTATSSHAAEQQKATRRKIIIVLVLVVVTLLILTIILYATGYFASLSQEPESWERYL
jgi:cytochrome c-type biogenesis protein CcmH/NrfG